MSASSNPKSFREAFLITFLVLALGIVVELIMHGAPVEIPAFPYNLALILLFFFYPLLAKLLLGKKIVEKLSSIPLTIASITVYTVLVIAMGSFMQDNPNPASWEQNLGLSHIARTWYFLFVSILMMTVLGFTILKRFHHLKNIRNIAFLLNHLGIWIVIAAASLGTGDLQRIKLVVTTEQANHLGLNTKTNGIVPLSFSVRLDSFLLKEYQPTLAFVNPSTKELITEFSSYKEGDILHFNGWDITVMKTYDKSILNGSEYQPSSEIGAVHSILLDIKKDTRHIRQWIAAPEMEKKGNLLSLNMKEGLALLPAEVKQYQSKITILDNHKPPLHTLVSVNHPFHYAGWDIYQFDYEQTKGRWSSYSVLELVHDPWLIPVYIGIFMLLAGAMLLLWFGKFK